MENECSLKSDFLNDLIKRKFLTIMNSEIFLQNISLELFTDLKDNKKNQQHLSFILFLVNTIIEKTESTTILNVCFKGDVDLQKVSFKSLERIFFLFYSQATLTKFIENKKFYVNFPQIQKGENLSFAKEIKENFVNGDEIFIIDFTEDFNSQTNITNLIELNEKIGDINKKKLYCFGEKELSNYLEANPDLEGLKEGISKLEKFISDMSDDLQLFAFEEVALGGSFDHYHMGHNMLLATAALLCQKKMYIGITSDELVSKKSKSCLLQPFTVRESSVRMSLEKIGYEGEVFIFMLQDPVGKAGTADNLQALIVTGETLKGGEYVNEVRRKNKLKELPLIVANLICKTGPHDFPKISSTSIRNRLIQDSSCEVLEALETHWSKLTLAVLKCCKDMSLNWFSHIRDYYMQSWRQYHTLNHIYKYITNAESLIQQKKIKDNINVLLAIWFHDIIYTPSRPDNEERSAEKFMQFFENIKSGLVLEHTVDLINPEKVIKLIMATKAHFTEDYYEDEELNYFLDLDLCTFAEENFEKYMEINASFEYEFSHHLTKDEWKQGRRKFLESLLNKKIIFRTEEFRKKFEETAKRNICRELELLCK